MKSLTPLIRHQHHGLTIALAAAAALILSVSAHASAFKGKYPIRVGATVGMVADIVREVAADHAAVTPIIGSGVDPHVYSPTRSDVAVLLRSDILFYSGLLLEGQMTDILVKVSRKRPVYAVTERLRQDYLIHDNTTNHHDPHVWMDVNGWIQAVSVVADAMADFDPVNAAAYQGNAAAYQARLRRLDDYARAVIASIPDNQRVLVTAHDAFNYLSRAYGIEVMGIQGLSTESEAGLKDINRLVGLLVDRQIPAVFVETSVSDKNVKALIEGAASRGHRVIIGGELFSDAMGTAGTYEGTYEGMIDHNVTVIARALGGNAPAGGMQGKLEGH
ncbi:manganese transporter [Desulfosarcina alkanivorans]|uniref:Manganese transporter n=1 Tax=Desulfosarcina alkanivorans TaxID=571177 RepID=A0A5K7YHP8_9BACT|nr:zinc ABC transporter substrate-binding protein [Desulfosarcina alkanivorans]BBO67610.1 manganese transporter [Desulfosarcina alkanivorans]